jgi:hypothetical protein
VAWLSLLLALLKIAGVVADYLANKQLLDAGAKAQVADALVDLNKRLNVGLAIQREGRGTAGDLDELRRGGM